MKLTTETIQKAILIREVELSLLNLFSQGKLHGTVHTCVGQEFSAIAFAGQLQENDFVFSSHRCHGHYLAYCGDCEGLISELMGKKNGVCGGIGGSQHICKNNFFSNGIQGGIVPVAAGMALAEKLRASNAIGIVFIGDGTFGEGVVYETLNILSKWAIPLLVVCEDNGYAQSSAKVNTMAGDIVARAEAFGIQTYCGTTFSPEELIDQAKAAISKVRMEKKPGFFLVNTYRLAPHSKGDDNRDPNEIKSFQERDPLNSYARNNSEEYNLWKAQAFERVQRAIVSAESMTASTFEEYYHQPAPAQADEEWQILSAIDQRQVKLINMFFQDAMEKNPKLVFIGEDVLSPYGGAFKAAQGLSERFPDRVFSTPISEAAITGIANGLALRGFRPFLEIMFGDFVTLAFDQIVNHASKFHHMYNKKVRCPLVIRMPMGGRRGYGPTHSQTLDKHLIGIDNITVVALNQLISPEVIYNDILNQEHPVIVIENKADYSRKIASVRSRNFVYERTKDSIPTARIRPLHSTPTITLVTYGGAVQVVLEVLDCLFEEQDLIPEVIIPSAIHPLKIHPILSSVLRTQRLFVIEEGSVAGGFGSEVISSIIECVHKPIIAKRIGALPVPLPSSPDLESKCLPNSNRIVSCIKAALQ